MYVRTEYGSSTRIGPPPAVRDAYSCTTAITFTSVRSGNLLSGFDETFETFRSA